MTDIASNSSVVHSSRVAYALVASSAREKSQMKLAKVAGKLTPKHEQAESRETPVPKKTKRIITDPEDTPQEPKNRVNRRELARLNRRSRNR